MRRKLAPPRRVPAKLVLLKARSHWRNFAGALLERNAVYARPPLTFLEGPSYRSESFELHKILRAVRRGKFSAPAKFTPAPPTPSQSLASLDASSWTLGGCKRFTSGHGVAGTVSGVEAAIHVGNELWFGVGIEVSERDQNLAISTRWHQLGATGN
ncbi:hypothetical protein Bbelb_310560 [Branchiostoma belcheri]|nr:hypothetical protein Bbelb_310560 [Branchiostoma belcheri]